MLTECDLPAQFKFITLNIHGGLDKKLAMIRQWQHNEHISAIALTETGTAPATVEPQLFVTPNMNTGDQTQAGCAILLAPWLTPASSSTRLTMVLLFQSQSSSTTSRSTWWRPMLPPAPSTTLLWHTSTGNTYSPMSSHSLTAHSSSAWTPTMLLISLTLSTLICGWMLNSVFLPLPSSGSRQDSTMSSRHPTLVHLPPPTSNLLQRQQPSGHTAITRRKLPTWSVRTSARLPHASMWWQPLPTWPWEHTARCWKQHQSRQTTGLSKPSSLPLVCGPGHHTHPSLSNDSSLTSRMPLSNSGRCMLAS